jgi:hypothetical protein
VLNGNPIRRDALGRLLAVTPGATVYFNGGTTLASLGDVQVVQWPVAPPTYVNGGLLYDNDGHLVVDPVGAIAGYVQGGLPVTANGALCTEGNGVPVTFNAGIPISATGRVCGVPAVAPTDFFAFSNAFNNAFDVAGV